MSFPTRRSVVLSALTHLGGSLTMIMDSGPSSTELRFPKLARVDGAITISQVGSIALLDLSALTTVGELTLQYVHNNADIRLGNLRTVARTIAVMSLPRIGYRPLFARLADAAEVSVGQGRLVILVGCSVTGNSSPDCPAQ